MEQFSVHLFNILAEVVKKIQRKVIFKSSVRLLMFIFLHRVCLFALTYIEIENIGTHGEMNSIQGFTEEVRGEGYNVEMSIRPSLSYIYILNY